jgi:pimeloyl-ACP methyl ester carboxylesterase
MSTFVLVHGGAHGGWCWRKLTPLLRAAGHDVYTPTMTGLGERSHLVGPGVDLDIHIQDIVSVLEYEDLTDVILVGHSYGGIVITGVADRALERVGQLVYLDAVIPKDGEGLISIMPEAMVWARSVGQTVDGVELVLWPEPDAGAFYGVTDREDLAWMQTRLMPQPWKTFEQPLHFSNEAKVSALPSTVINCTQNERKTSLTEQNVRARKADRVWEIDADHDVMITQPDAVAEMLLRLA